MLLVTVVVDISVSYIGTIIQQQQMNKGLFIHTATEIKNKIKNMLVTYGLLTINIRASNIKIGRIQSDIGIHIKKACHTEVPTKPSQIDF